MAYKSVPCYLSDLIFHQSTPLSFHFSHTELLLLLKDSKHTIQPQGLCIYLLLCLLECTSLSIYMASFLFDHIWLYQLGSLENGNMPASTPPFPAVFFSVVLNTIWYALICLFFIFLTQKQLDKT